MADRADLRHWRRYPASITAGDLMRAAEERGWRLRNQSGSHRIYVKDGTRAHLSIPSNVKGIGTKRAIIDTLLEAESDG